MKVIDNFELLTKSEQKPLLEFLSRNPTQEQLDEFCRNRNYVCVIEDEHYCIFRVKGYRHNDQSKS